MAKVSMALRAKLSFAIPDKKREPASTSVWLLSPAAQNQSRSGPQHALAGPMGRRSRTISKLKKGIIAVGDLAFYPDRVMGGMRRQTHWDNARKTRPHRRRKHDGQETNSLRAASCFWTEMFDLRMEFVGDSACCRPCELHGRTRRKICAR